MASRRPLRRLSQSVCQSGSSPLPRLPREGGRRSQDQAALRLAAGTSADGEPLFRRVEVEAPARRLGARMFATSREARFNNHAAANAWARKREPRKAYRMVRRCDFAEDCPSRVPIEVWERRDDR